MAEAPARDGNRALEEEVWVAISAFEQILEALPNDRASLEALSHAYGQIGDHVREKEYIVRLAEVLVKDGDHDEAQQVAEQLKQFADEDPQVRSILERIETMSMTSAAARGAGAGGEAPVTSIRSGFNMADELSFAWELLQAGQLSEQEYSGLVHDLTEMSAAASSTTISVLHALEFRNAKNLDKIMAYVSEVCATPIVTISSFGTTTEAMAMLPLDFMIRRGATVFEMIGQDALVAVMNPYNKQLRGEIEAMIRRKCHFFLVLPSDFDQSLTRVRSVLTEKTEEQNRTA
jgi:hypothetical protein